MSCSLIGGIWVCISQGRLLSIPRKLNSKELPEERCIFTPITMKQVERVGGGGEGGRWWRGWEDTGRWEVALSSTQTFRSVTSGYVCIMQDSTVQLWSSLVTCGYSVM